MRLLAIVVLLLGEFACSAQADQPLPGDAGSTYGVFARLIGEYYVAHHTWPSSMRELRAFAVRRAARESRPDESKGVARIWSSFTHVEFKAIGKDLLVFARLRSEGQKFRYDAIFHPGRSAEEIVDTMSSE